VTSTVGVDIDALLVGVDIEDLDVWERLVRSVRWKWFAPLFTSDEIAYCQKQQLPAVSFGGLFAAKEAVLKALWPTLELTVQSVAISHDNGRPSVSVSHPDFHQWTCDVSIAHSRLCVVAVCLARHTAVEEVSK
jgi:phosphopantetheine--protein transferase-like protein